MTLTVTRWSDPAERVVLLRQAICHDCRESIGWYSPSAVVTMTLAWRSYAHVLETLTCEDVSALAWSGVRLSFDHADWSCKCDDCAEYP